MRLGKYRACRTAGCSPTLSQGHTAGKFWGLEVEYKLPRLTPELGLNILSGHVKRFMPHQGWWQTARTREVQLLLLLLLFELFEF